MPVPMLVPMVLLMVTHLIELTLVLQMGLPQVVLGQPANNIIRCLESARVRVYCKLQCCWMYTTKLYAAKQIQDVGQHHPGYL